MVYVQHGNLLQSSLFVIQFLLNMTVDVFVLTRCNISTQQKWIRLTLLDSIYKTESSDLFDNLPGMDYTNAKKKNHHNGALDWKTARLSIGTAMHSGSEHRKTRRVFSYPSNMTSKYS